MTTAKQELKRKKKPVGSGIMGKSKGKDTLKKGTGKGITRGNKG